jgi:hypothetical protein
VLASRTALAAPASAQGGGKPTPSDEAFKDPIGTQVTRMFMLRPEPRPALPPPGLDAPAGKRKPYVGEAIDAVKFSPQAAAEAKSRGEALSLHRRGHPDLSRMRRREVRGFGMTVIHGG